MSNQSQQADEATHQLLRLVTRAFYPHQCVLIIEALLFHSVLYEEDLVKLTCLHKKAFRSFLNKLIEDRLVVSFTQKEHSGAGSGSGQFRLVTRTYFYIHFIEAIDSVKWKVHNLVKTIKDEIGNLGDPMGYMCPICHAKFSLLDVSTLLSEDKSCFVCSICGSDLVDDDSGLEAQKGQEKLETLMNQLKTTIDTLKRIDDLRIEDNNFESSLIKHIPASSTSLAAYSVFNKGNKLTRKEKELLAKERANGNYYKKSQASINVEITANEEDLKRREQELQNAKNEKLRQNALPSWVAQSTIGEAALGKLDGVDRVEGEGETEDADGEVKQEPGEEGEIKQEGEGGEEASEIKTENGGDSTVDTLTSNGAATVTTAAPTTAESTEEMDALTAYYAQLKQRQADEEAIEDEEDAEEDEDIDEDEFEAFGDDEEMIDEAEFEDTPVETKTTSNGSAAPLTSTAANAATDDIEELDEDDIDEADFEDIASDAD